MKSMNPYRDAAFFGMTLAELAEVLKALEQRRTANKMMVELFKGAEAQAPAESKEQARIRRVSAEADGAMAASASVQLAMALQGIEDGLEKEGRIETSERVSPPEGHEDRVKPADAARMREKAAEYAEEYDLLMHEVESKEATAKDEVAKPVGLADMKPVGRA